MARTCLFVVCGAPLARRAPDIARALVAAGWALQVAVTEAGQAWLDVDELADAAGAAARTAHRTPDQPKDRSQPDAVLVCPATFNTVNKLALGIADTYVLSALNEALGSRVPTLIVPMVNDKLWGHPAWDEHRARLATAGARLLSPVREASPDQPVRSGTGDEVTASMDVDWLVHQLGAGATGSAG